MYGVGCPRKKKMCVGGGVHAPLRISNGIALNHSSGLLQDIMQLLLEIYVKFRVKNPPLVHRP